MFYSIVDAIGTGSAANVSVPPYIDKSHIFVYVDHLPFTAFEWINAQTISVVAQLNRPIRVVRRTSPETRLTVYTDGQALPGDTLEVDSLQAFYMAQEALDLALLAGGTIGTPTPGIELTQQGLKDLLNGMITPSELELQLREEIALITGAEDVIGSVAWKVYQESLARAAALTAEADARVAALLQEAQDRDAAITVETQARQSAIDSLAQQITTLTASLNNNLAAVQSEQLARIDEDGALAQRVDTVVAATETNAAAITQNATTSANQLNALASSVEAMRADLETADADLSAKQVTETETRVAEDSALAGRISVFEAGGTSDVEAVKARVTSAEQAIVEEGEARAVAVESVDTAWREADTLTQARILAAETAISNGDEALATRASALEAKVDVPDGTTVGNMIADVQDAMASGDEANAQAITTVQSRVQSRPNLQPNGSFEEGITGWTRSLGPTYSEWTAEDNPEWGRIGIARGSWSGQFGFWSPPFPVSAGQTYTCHADTMLTATSGEVSLDLRWQDASGGYISLSSQNRITAPHNFSINDSNREVLAVSGDAPAGAATCRVRFTVYDSVGVTAVGIRQLKVERGPLPFTAYTSEAANVAAVNRVASVEEQSSTSADKLGNVEANHTIKVQVRTDGKRAIAGIGLLASGGESEPTQSELVFMADKMTFVPGAADYNALPQPLFVAGVVDGQNTFVVPPQRFGDKLLEARMIVDGGVEARHMKVTGGGQAVNLDPWTMDYTAWQINSYDPSPNNIVQVTDGPAGKTALTLTGSLTMYGKLFPVKAGRAYKVSLFAKKVVVGGDQYFRLQFRDKNGAELQRNVLDENGNVLGPVNVPTAWTEYWGTAVAPVGAVEARLYFIGNYQSTGTVLVQAFRCEELLDHTFIVKGGIKADRIDTDGLEIKDDAGNVILRSGDTRPPSVMNTGPNLIRNGEFINDTHNSIDVKGWTRILSGTPNNAQVLSPASTQSYSPPWNPRGPMLYSRTTDDTSYVRWETQGYIGIDPAQNYNLSCWLRTYTGQGKIYLGLWCYDSEYVALGNPVYTHTVYQPGTTWELISGVLGPSGKALFAGTRYVRLIFYGQYKLAGSTMASRFALVEGTTPPTNYGSYVPQAISDVNPVDGTNVSTYIKDAAIGAAQIGSLGVGTLSTTMSGGVSSGGRITMEANKLRVYDASNALRVKLGYLL